MAKEANKLIDEWLEQPAKIVKPEIVKYTESIETIMSNGLKRWIKIKVSGKGISIEEAAMDAKTKFDKALNVVCNPEPLPTQTDYHSGPTLEIQVESMEKRMAHFIADINACDKIDEINTLGVQVGLIAYSDMVCGHPELQEAYDKKLEELSK